MADTIRTIGEQAGKFFERLGATIRPINQTEKLLNSLGWSLPPGLDDIGLGALDFAEVVDKLRTLLDSSREERDDELLMAQRVTELTIALAEAAGRVRQFAADLPTNLSGFDDYISRSRIHEELPKRLFDFWVMTSMAGGAPLTFSLLHLLNIFEYKRFEANEETFQVTHVRAIIHFDHFKTLLDDPVAHFQEAYGWGTPQFLAMDLLNRLGRVLMSLGADVEMQQLRGPTLQALTQQPLTDPESVVVLQVLTTLHEELGEIAGLKLGFSLFEVPPTTTGGADRGIGFWPIVRGAAQGGIPFFAFDDTFIDLSIESELLSGIAMILRPNQDLAVKTASDLRDTITGRFAFGPPPW